jgi:hypothetical protein
MPFGIVTECPIQEFIGDTSNVIYILEHDTLTVTARQAIQVHQETVMTKSPVS